MKKKPIPVLVLWYPIYFSRQKLEKYTTKHLWIPEPVILILQKTVYEARDWQGKEGLCVISTEILRGLLV